MENKEKTSAKETPEEKVTATETCQENVSENETPEAKTSNGEVTKKDIKPLRGRRLVVSLVCIGIIAYGLWRLVDVFIEYTASETCNDAQIEQYITPVNLRASGYIAKVCFKEHQEVHKGDTLLILDDREYRIRLMEAEAALKDAKAGANVNSATEQTTQTSASVYSASIDEIEVRLAKLSKDIERYRNLVANKAATPIQLEQLEVEYDATKKKLEAARKQQEAAYKGVNEVTTRRGNVDAAIQRAEAAVEMARLNLSYCVVVAPCDGKLGRRTIEEGQMVNAGTTITYIIPDNQKWVIANYKETQIENLHVGQKVRMTVDALNNEVFEGTVTAISGATGAKYSLVPTDNSAGNFVKIQQRVPVRIDFTNISKEDNDRLAAGMMVVVKVERKDRQ
ncbi:MAG: HlyD family secretion protein [Sodaliphilus sp.]|jgi:membrane fusion protein (multidrug efflux system)|nr:HlyD family secretion protein [Muribaculaceae bacterium]MCI6078634.1 HlyD family secretion protein [Bacteroidales bacterium]MDY2592299.1 HlyD family secretion protein [Sodaliphilus sp.]HAO62726.1 hemolysin D [Porphyromonadaceae bacterium]MCI6146289.1 HlyD family secretion protein [Bacteroidales bacterium]